MINDGALLHREKGADEVARHIWVFNGEGCRFPAGALSSRDIAEREIEAHSMSGILTAYPVDIFVYHWAIRESFFEPSRPDQETPEFMQKFSSASQEHYHYENGSLA